MNSRYYELIKELGRGTYGVTFLGNDNNGIKVAIKTINIKKSEKLGADIKSINEEIDTLKLLSKGNYAKYVAHYRDSFINTLDEEPTVFIISEYIDGGSLSNMLNEGNIITSYLWPIMLQLLLGLKYIHAQGYAHRDIKPDNILITENFNIKYIDFGLACLQKCRLNTCHNICEGRGGTLFYMPPEYFNGSKIDYSLEESKSHDIWSLAIIFFELCNGKFHYPFNIYNSDISRMSTNIDPILSDKKIMEQIARSPIYVSNYTLDDGRSDIFIDSLLINDWKKRPTIYTSIDKFINNISTIVSDSEIY